MYGKEITDLLLITTGMTFNSKFVAHHEIVSFNEAKSKSCTKYDKHNNRRVRFATGGFVKNTPVICGGLGKKKDCVDARHKDKKLSTLRSGRYGASTVVIPSKAKPGVDELWILGGAKDINKPGQISTEYVLPFAYKASRPGPDLPEALAFHCALRLNATTVLVMGGWAPRELTKRSYFFHLPSQKWTSGPNLKKARCNFACGHTFLRGLKNPTLVAIAAGGVYKRASNSRTKTTEILRVTWNKPAWFYGPDLPTEKGGIGFASGLSTPDGRFLFVGGNKSLKSGQLKSILELRCNMQWQPARSLKDACQWILLKELKMARSIMVAMFIPPERNIC